VIAVHPQPRLVRTAVAAFALAAGMMGLGYASVPLYRMFCQVTGFGGTTQRVAESALPKPVIGKTINVRFDANHARELPWTFEPEKHLDQVTIGEREMAFYNAKNLSARTITGTAAFNVSPSSAGKYFSKIQCFCFTEQTLKPGEEVRMPVTYFVDPKILDDPDAGKIEEITLSYTFYPVDAGKKGS
jgi:cytochrome c oxidase assembly protein subunit 11